MQAHIFFFHLLLILLTARLFAEIASRMRMPSVIGEIMAGILIGPSILGIIEHDETIRLLAEIGIILLLFEVGIELDVGRLRLRLAALPPGSIPVGALLDPDADVRLLDAAGDTDE